MGVSRRARMIRATAFFFLLLQAASTHQASVPTDANLVLTAAAESLENVLGLDYNVLEPTFRDIDLVKENLVELMPYLEESERPVITTAYANLLDLEGTLSVDFEHIFGHSIRKYKRACRGLRQRTEASESCLDICRSFQKHDEGCRTKEDPSSALQIFPRLERHLPNDCIWGHIGYDI